MRARLSIRSSSAAFVGQRGPDWQDTAAPPSLRSARVAAEEKGSSLLFIPGGAVCGAKNKMCTQEEHLVTLSNAADSLWLLLMKQSSGHGGHMRPMFTSTSWHNIHLLFWLKHLLLLPPPHTLKATQKKKTANREGEIGCGHCFMRIIRKFVKAEGRKQE